MEITIAALCDGANVRENLLNMVGVGLNRVHMPVYPSPLQVTFALRLEMEIAESQSGHALLVEIVDVENDSVLGHFNGTVAPVPVGNVLETDLPVQAVATLSLASIQIPKPGRYDLTINVDDSLLKRVKFAVRPDPVPGATARISAVPGAVPYVDSTASVGT